MNRNSRIAIICGSLVVAGCAPTFQWARPDTTREAFQLDAAQCKYEAIRETPGFSAGQTPRKASAAAMQSAIESVVTTLDQVARAKLCMQARGYTMEPLAEGATPTPQWVEASVMARRKDSEVAITPLYAPGSYPSRPMTDDEREELVVLASSGAVELTRKTSRYQYSAEQFAKGSVGCPHPVGVMSYFSPGVETFVVTCGDGEPLMIRCAWGVCSALIPKS